MPTVGIESVASSLGGCRELGKLALFLRKGGDTLLPTVAAAYMGLSEN